MRRRKRFTIRLVALGLATAAVATPTALAIPDEGLNGLQPIEVVSLRTADDVAHPSLAESQPVVSSDDGFTITTLGISGIVLLLAAGAAFMAMHQVRRPHPA